MRTRARYRLERIDVAALDVRAASWTFAGEPVRGAEHAYVVIDRNLRAGNEWEFVVRVPEAKGERVEVRPRRTPSAAVFAELPDRSLTFVPATKGAARGRWYCQVALADASGERSKAVVRTAERSLLPGWFKPLASSMRRKEAVKATRGTDADALVVLVAGGDHAGMIRLFFAAKVWVLREGFVLPREG
jgi:hypothetical protein